MLSLMNKVKELLMIVVKALHVLLLGSELDMGA